MNQFYEGRIIRELQDQRELHQVEKVEGFYEGEYRDFRVTIDLGEVLEFAESVVTNCGMYNGADLTWVHLKNGTCSGLLVKYDKFKEAMEDYYAYLESEGKTMLNVLMNIEEE